MAILGAIAVLAIAFALSRKRSAINPRTVAAAFGLQVLLAAAIIYVPWGQKALAGVVRGVQHVIDYANDGIEFVFGAALEADAFLGDAGNRVTAHVNQRHVVAVIGLVIVGLEGYALGAEGVIFRA